MPLKPGKKVKVRNKTSNSHVEDLFAIKKITVGTLQTNCYLMYNQKSKESLVIDPGDDLEFITSSISSLELNPIAILATHGHFDHILAASQLQQIYKVPFYCHKEDKFLVDSMKKRAERWLSRKIVESPPKISGFLDKDLKINNFRMKILHTPGHTPGSVCFHFRDQKILFSGDVIFDRGAVGRYDFSYSSKTQLEKSIKLILELEDSTKIFPGHGKNTYVKKERKYHK